MMQLNEYNSQIQSFTKRLNPLHLITLQLK